MAQRKHSRVKMVLPVRITRTDASGKPVSQLAHTLDFSRRGARVGGLQFVPELGDVLTVEYKRQRAQFTVRWVGTQGTPTSRQAGLENVNPEAFIWIDIPDERFVDDPNAVKLRATPKTPAPAPAPATAVAAAAGAGSAKTQAAPAAAPPRSGVVPIRSQQSRIGEDALAELERKLRTEKLGVEEALQLITETAYGLMQAAGSALALRDKQEMVCRASAGIAPMLGIRFQPDAGIVSGVLRSRTTVVCADTETCPDVDPEVWRSAGLRSVIITPVLAGENSFGVFESYSANPSFFDARHRVLLEHLAKLVAEVLSWQPSVPQS